jgi:hypothetical protein
MKVRNITLAVAMTLLVATSVRAELRHVELKTLGMD